MEFITTGPRLSRLLQVNVFDCCKRLARKSEFLFVATFAIASIILSAAAEFGLSKVGLGDYETPALLTRNVAVLLFMTVLFAPLFETLLLQQLPICLAKRLGLSRGAQFLAGSVPFAVVHFDAGLVSGLAAGVMGGVFLGLAYVTFLQQSKSKAFVITASIHSLHNLLPAIVIARDLL